MAAEVRAVVMARTTWSGPTAMDWSILAKDAVCHVCGKKGHFARDCWHQSGNKGSGKGKKGKKGKKGQGKGTKPKDGDTKQKGACHNCGEVGQFARECPKKKEASNASSSGGGGVHCLTYTDVRGVKINVRATFELLPVRRPILSVSRLVEKGLAVVMGKEHGNTLCKDGRVTHLHKSNGVYHVRATALSELCPLEDQDPRNDDVPPAEAVGEANVPWTRRLPYKHTEDERFAHLVTNLPFRAWCPHCIKWLARVWTHRSDCGPLPDIPMVAMDFCFCELYVKN